MIARVHCEQDHCRFWGNGANLSGRFQTIHNRHRQVQDDDIRAKGFDSFDRNSSILCLAANSPIAPLLEPGSKRSTDFGAVVHDQHCSRHLGLKERVEQARQTETAHTKRPLRDHCGSVQRRQYSRNCTLSIISGYAFVPYIARPPRTSFLQLRLLAALLCPLPQCLRHLPARKPRSPLKPGLAHQHRL